MKSTPEIIELARKLYATGYRQEITYGTFYGYKDRLGDGVDVWPYPDSPKDINVDGWEDFIPIPTLTDCLDWLEYHGHEPHIIPPFHSIDSSLSHEWLCGANGEKTEAPTPEEACMKAMLKILEGE